MNTILMAAITVNGMIAKDITSGASWTEDKQLFKDVTEKAGVVIFGRKTFEIDLKKKPLPGRLNIILTRNNSYPDIPGTLEFMNGSPEEIVSSIAEKGFKECIIGGGSSVYTSFLESGMVSELLLTVAPKIFSSGVPLFGQLHTSCDLTLKHVKQRDNGDILLRYII